MSNNIYKANFIQFTPDNTKVIDTNSLVAKRLEGFSTVLREETYEEEYSEEYVSDEEQAMDALLEDRDGFVSFSEVHEENLEEAMASVAKMREEAEAEIQEMKADATKEIESMQQEVLEIARRQGYEEGCEKAKKELDEKLRELDDKGKALEKEYSLLAGELEPKIVAAITDVYSKIFGDSLYNKKDVLTALVTKALFGIGNEEDIVIYVSSEDFVEIGENEDEIFGKIQYKKQPEIRVNDSFSSGKVKIETKYGIVDCSIDTELNELSRTLQMLSYEGKTK